MPFSIKFHRGILKPLLPKAKDRAPAQPTQQAQPDGAPAGRRASTQAPPPRNLFRFIEITRTGPQPPVPSVPLTASVTSNASRTNGDVRALNAEEAEEAVQKLIADVRSLRDVRGSVVPSTQHQEWQNRVRNTLKIAGQLDESADFVMGCFFDSRPIGLITLNRPDEEDSSNRRALEIEDFVTHPRSTGVGSALMEQAATVSHRQGYGGNLVALAQDGSREAYEAMGFTTDGIWMTLNPSSPENRDRWQLQGGEWRRKKDPTKPSAVSMAEFGPGPSRSTHDQA